MTTPQPPPKPEERDAFDLVLDAMANAKGPDGKPREPVTYAEFQKMMDETPLFMRETPEDTRGDYVLEALKSLAFDGDGDEIGLNFKTHGNELYAQKSYKDAIDAYTSGLNAGASDYNLRVTLLNNRAAAHLMLKNYRAVLTDTGSIMTLAGLQSPPRDPPAKALHRSAQALVGLEKWREAADAIARGRALPGEDKNAAWDTLQATVDAGLRRVQERVERARRTRETDAALKAAVKDRGLIAVTTSAPPQNPTPLHFDPDALGPETPLYPKDEADKWTPPGPQTPLVYPTFLLYPAHQTSDLITHFHEDTSLDQQLEPIFPSSPNATSPPWSDWDTRHEYYGPNLSVYAETNARRLLKVGKEITLREVIQKAHRAAKDGQQEDGIPLRDGLLSFIVVPRGKEEKEFVERFKRERDGK